MSQYVLANISLFFSSILRVLCVLDVRCLAGLALGIYVRDVDEITSKFATFEPSFVLKLLLAAGCSCCYPGRALLNVAGRAVS